jgi:plasmanylethanolamine desaturase
LVAADLASGLVHWFCDRFLEEDTPVVGALLIFPFRDHHRDPAAMTRHGFLELSGNSCLGMLPILALAGLRPLPVGVDAAVVALALAILLTNLAHCWAHAGRLVPPLVARLQAWGLLLRPGAHAVHHAPGHRGAYCVTSGWANRWVDGLGLFRGLERVLVALGVPATRQA